MFEPLDSEWEGYASLETILVRLNTSLAPQGNFGSYAPAEDDSSTTVGYDAGVCLSLREPWVLDVRVSGQNAFTTVIVGLGSQLMDAHEIGMKGDRSSGLDAGLDGFGSKWDMERLRRPVRVAYRNGVNHLLRSGNGAGRGRYTPSPMVSYSLYA